MERQIALINNSDSVSEDIFIQVCSAIQKQMTNDFYPAWNINAVVSAFTDPDSVPSNFWRVYLEENIDQQGALGIHHFDDKNPYALVGASGNWPQTLSHEICEMLSDPSGNSNSIGTSPLQGQGQVEFLIEVCDPCQDIAFAYDVNGFRLSDFCLPSYYNSVNNQAPFSFAGNIKQAKQVLTKGYLSWRIPSTGEWWQQHCASDGSFSFVKLGSMPNPTLSLRENIDCLTRKYISAPKKFKTFSSDYVHNFKANAGKSHRNKIKRQVEMIKKRIL